MNARQFFDEFFAYWRSSFSLVEEFEPIFEHSKRLNEWFKEAMCHVCAQSDLRGGRCVNERPFKLDAAFVSGSYDLNQKWEEGFSHLHVAIEFEATDWPDDEIWKLVFIRCPLKVVFFYPHEPGSPTKDSRTLSTYLSEVERYLEKSLGAHPEPDGTEYLLVAGVREGHGHPVLWKATNLIAKRSGFTTETLESG